METVLTGLDRCLTRQKLNSNVDKAQYLSDGSRLEILGAVVPSIFTALLLQSGEEDLWTRSHGRLVVAHFRGGSETKCRKVLHLIQLIPTTTAPLRLPCCLLTRKHYCYQSLFPFDEVQQGPGEEEYT